MFTSKSNTHNVFDGYVYDDFTAEDRFDFWPLGKEPAIDVWCTIDDEWSHVSPSYESFYASQVLSRSLQNQLHAKSDSCAIHKTWGTVVGQTS